MPSYHMGVLIFLFSWSLVQRPERGRNKKRDFTYTIFAFGGSTRNHSPGGWLDLYLFREEHHQTSLDAGIAVQQQPDARSCLS